MCISQYPDTLDALIRGLLYTHEHDNLGLIAYLDMLHLSLDPWSTTNRDIRSDIG